MLKILFPALFCKCTLLNHEEKVITNSSQLPYRLFLEYYVIVYHVIMALKYSTLSIKPLKDSNRNNHKRQCKPITST